MASIEVSMPKMGESVMEGTILKWHKKTGDKLRKMKYFLK
jgi:pyruvate/2-oxoglutarate dehydrogenase complex dihydrolipoamide acyltransferase (E2) component